MKRILSSLLLCVAGEWVGLCTYAVFDGDTLRMENFIEGETQP